MKLPSVVSSLVNPTLQKMIVEITINWLPQFRKSIVFETELTTKMFILTIIFYSVVYY